MDCSNLLRSNRPRIEAPRARSLDRQRRQHAGPISASVDADAVGSKLDFRADRMPMDDHESVIGVVVQERLADPAKVGLTLLLDLDPGADARVDEEIIPEAAGVDKASEELLMLLGNRLAHDF